MNQDLTVPDIASSPKLPTVLLSWQVPSAANNEVFSSSQIGEIYPFRSTVSGWIDGAIEQLNDIDIEAKEEGYPEVNHNAKEIAAHLLTMLDRHRIEPDVYPSVDGDIAMYFKAPNRPFSFLITIDNGQTIECYMADNGDCKHIGFGVLSEEALDYMHDVLNKMESSISLQGGLVGTRR